MGWEDGREEELSREEDRGKWGGGLPRSPSASSPPSPPQPPLPYPSSATSSPRMTVATSSSLSTMTTTRQWLQDGTPILQKIMTCVLHVLTRPVNRVKDATSYETASQTAQGVDCKLFCELENELYPVLRLRDAIQTGA